MDSLPCSRNDEDLKILIFTTIHLSLTSISLLRLFLVRDCAGQWSVVGSNNAVLPIRL